jgi:glycosyltransferase involved in cell wall biosynthesis
MKKIIFLGGEDVSARIEISKKFIALGYEVEIIGTEKGDKFIQNNILYRKYSLNRELNIFNDIKTIFELRKILKEENEIIIVHAFDTKPTMFLPLAAIGLKNIKVVRTITGMGRIFTEESAKNSMLKFVYNLIQKLISKRVDFTIFQNDDDAAYFVEHKLISKNDSSVIKSSGLDLATYTKNIEKINAEDIKNTLDLDVTQPTFILVSRMVKQKGILDYLEAAKQCYDNGHKFNFLLVGQLDSDKSITLDQIEEYKQYVKYLGRREDIQTLLSVSDVFVLPTYYREGVPRVLLEASAMGLAIITTDMPGCKDVVTDGYNGKLVKTKDNKDLYEKMVFLGTHPEEIAMYAENAKEKVKEFDLGIVVNEYDKVYKSLGGN